MTKKYRPPITFVILADYGWGPVRVATHTALHQATVQAEHRFMTSGARCVQVRRSDRLNQPLQDNDGRALEWRAA